MISFLLRMIAVLALAGGIFLVLYRPSENVAGVNLLTKANLSVQCSSLWDQWNHHARPASLDVNGSPLVPLQAAESACQAGSNKIKHVDEGLVAGAVVALGASFIFRKRR
jgi:hypothetical protein